MSFDMDRAVHENQRLVYKLARKYCRPGIEFLDLVQEGNLGLLTAAERFDASKGVKFFTYAWYWVRSYIQRYAAAAYPAGVCDDCECHPENMTSPRNVVDNGLVLLPLDQIAAEVFPPEAQIDFGRLQECMGNLSKRDLYILIETIVKGRTLEDVGETLPQAVNSRVLSRERVRQIRKSSLETLHKSLISP